MSGQDFRATLSALLDGARRNLERTADELERTSPKKARALRRELAKFDTRKVKPVRAEDVMPAAMIDDIRQHGLKAALERSGEPVIVDRAE